MQTRALRTLVEIDRIGSFARAATHLNMTLSAVSMQMKALESELGASLFDRSFRPPRLTPLGKSICAQAERLLLIEHELRAQCEPSDQLTGRYKIGLVPTASIRLLPGFMLRARERAPNVQFDIVTGLSDALERAVGDGDLDFAVTTAAASESPPPNQHVLQRERMLFAAPQRAGFRSVRELASDMPFLHFTPSSGIGKLIATHMRERGGENYTPMVLDSVEAILECVNCGLGFTLLPEPDIRRYASTDVHVFSDGDTELSRDLALIWDQRSKRRVQAEMIGEMFSDNAGARGLEAYSPT